MYGAGHPECPSGYDRMHPPEDAFMVPGMGAQPVPVREWVAANDNHPDWDGIVKTAAYRFSTVHETLAKSERGQYVGLTRPGDQNGCADDLVTTTFAPLEELPVARLNETGGARLIADGVLGCLDCGKPYSKFPDLIIDNDAFAKIAPNPPDGGLLCPNCIHDRLVEAGLDNVRAKFTSGPLSCRDDGNVDATQPASLPLLWDAAGGYVGPTARHGDFMQTYTGRKFWPMDPRANEVCIRDIAHSLSLQCRYAGHCRRFYSVAEHSVHIARWLVGVAPEAALFGLLHDASEAYLIDVPRPVKPFLSGYMDAEAKVMAAVCQRFGLPLEMPAAVHEADERVIADELVNLVRMQWHARHDDPLGVTLRYWSPAEAEEEFLETFKALTGAVVGEVG